MAVRNDVMVIADGGRAGERPPGHADRGGVVSRDEIPLAYQRYIENYFRNLRAKDQN